MPDLVQGIFIGCALSDNDLLVLAERMNLAGPGPEDTIREFAQDVAAEIEAQVRCPIYQQDHGGRTLFSVFQPTACSMVEFLSFAERAHLLDKFMLNLGCIPTWFVGVDQREIN